MATIQTRDTRSFIAGAGDLWKKQFHVMTYADVAESSADIQFFEVEKGQFSAVFGGTAKIAFSDNNTKITISGQAAAQTTTAPDFKPFKLRVHVPHRFDEIVEIKPTNNNADQPEAMAQKVIDTIDLATDFAKDKSNLAPFVGEALTLTLDDSAVASGVITGEGTHFHEKFRGQRGIGICDDAAEAPVGILLNTPMKKDASATVAVSGVCPVVVGAVTSIDYGTPLVVTGSKGSEGRVVAFDPTKTGKNFSIGRALEKPSQAGQIISMEIDIQMMNLKSG